MEPSVETSGKSPQLPVPREIATIERPARQLLTYYAVQSLILGPLFPVLLLPHYLRYRSLRYRFDEEGISMRWGVLFRREINLTYARIQDIHLRSGAIERHLGLARIEVQTASGSASAEMTIEGVRQFVALRDFLYARMRGRSHGHDGRPATSHARSRPGTGSSAVDGEDLATVLQEVTAELRALRAELKARDENRQERSE